MKMSKFQIAVLVLLVVTVVYVIAVNQSMQAYETWNNEKYGSIRPWVDVGPFCVTPQGLLFCLCGFGILFFWGFAFLTRTKNRIAPALMAMVLVAYVFAVPWVFATTVHVDVYCVADEEARNSFGFPGSAECVLNFMRQYYLDTFDIEFHFHWWYYWDSDASNTDPITLLDEAIDDVNWYWRKIVDGEPMELMIVISGQCGNYEGYSPPWERAFIVGLGTGNVEFHEMGHQFGCGHCSEFPFPYWAACWMHHNGLVVSEFGCYYCDAHYSTIMANRELPLHPLLCVSKSSFGKVIVAPLWCYHFEYWEPALDLYYYSYGTFATVTAYDYYQYAFDYWILDGTRDYGNPITPLMNSDHSLKAHWVSSHAGPGPGKDNAQPL